MATVSVEIKMDEELQRAATDVFEKLGLDFSTAIKIFLKKSVLANEITKRSVLFAPCKN